MDIWFKIFIIVFCLTGLLLIIILPTRAHKKRVAEIIKNVRSTKRTIDI